MSKAKHIENNVWVKCSLRRTRSPYRAVVPCGCEEMRPSLAAILSLVLCVLPSVFSATNITVGTLLRFTSPSVGLLSVNGLGDNWKVIGASAVFAMHHFNSRNVTVLPAFGSIAGCDIHMNVDLHDTGSAAAPAVTSYLSSYQSWNMFVGAARLLFPFFCIFSLKFTSSW